MFTTADCVGPTHTPGAGSRQAQPQGLFLASTAPGRAGLRPRPHLPPTPRADSGQVPRAFVATPPWLHFALSKSPCLLSLWTSLSTGYLLSDPGLVLSLSKPRCPRSSKRILLKDKSDCVSPLRGSSPGGSQQNFYSGQVLSGASVTSMISDLPLTGPTSHSSPHFNMPDTFTPLGCALVLVQPGFSPPSGLCLAITSSEKPSLTTLLGKALTE